MNRSGFSLIEALISLFLLTIIGIAAMETTIFSVKITERAMLFQTMREHIEGVGVAGFFGMEPEDLIGETGSCEIISEPVELSLGTNVFQAVAWHVQIGTSPGLSAFIRE